MLAGMGGVSYHRLAAAVSEAGGFGCLGASTMSDDEMRAEMAAVREATDKPFGVDLLTAVPGDLEAKVRDIVAAGATAFVAGLGVPRDVIDLCHENASSSSTCAARSATPSRRVAAGCDRGPPRARRRAATGAGGPWALCPRSSRSATRCVTAPPAASSTDGAWPRALPWAPTACGSARFIATPEARACGATDVLLRARGRHGGHLAYTGKTCRVIATAAELRAGRSCSPTPSRCRSCARSRRA